MKALVVETSSDLFDCFLLSYYLLLKPLSPRVFLRSNAPLDMTNEVQGCVST